MTRTSFEGPIVADIPSPPTGVTVTPVTISGSATTGNLQLAGASSLVVGTDLTLHLVATGGTAEQDLDVTAAVTLQPGIADPGFGSDGNGIATVTPQNGGNNFSDLAQIAPQRHDHRGRRRRRLRELLPRP